MRRWLHDYFEKEYWKWKKRRQYQYKGWGWKYSAWVTMHWYRWLIGVLSLIFFFSVASKVTTALAFSVTGVQFQGGNENIAHEGSCAVHLFQLYRASDSAEMTDGVLGCTGSSPATEVVGAADILIGSFPYSGDFYVKSDSDTSNIFTLVSGDYTPSPTPTATPAATPNFQYVDIATNSALALGMNGLVQVIYNIGLITIIALGFLIGALVFLYP